VSAATLARPLTSLLRRDGRRVSAELSAEHQIEVYAGIVHAGAQGLVEVVGARRLADGRLGRFERGARDRFLDAGAGAALAARVRGELDVEWRELFVTPAALREPRGRNEAVAEAICAWVDLDDPERVEGLESFGHRPHLVVASGSGGRHAYWRLARPAGPDVVARANRMLCEQLGADRQSTNPARLMRLPGSANWKSGEPARCRILWADLANPGYELDQLVGGLRDPWGRGAGGRRPRALPTRRPPRPPPERLLLPGAGARLALLLLRGRRRTRAAGRGP
jgi:hypothetical protein